MGPRSATSGNGTLLVADGEGQWPWVVTFSLLFVLVVALLFSEWGFDDPFISYRYGDNLNKGPGFVYTLGERVLRTTSPLFALLLAGLEILCQTCPV